MKRILVLMSFLVLLLSSCKKGCTDENAVNYDSGAKKDDGSCVYDDPEILPIDANTEVLGYTILDRLPGIWDGPVSSPTPLGSFPSWIVDFRPISGAQVSAKNELDSINDIFMSFFIVKHDAVYKMAFRNGGGFAGQVRTSYMLLDSVSESGNNAYYRFSDPVSGGQRVYTSLQFISDSMIMTTYTNQYNSLPDPVLHMQWTCKRKDATSAQDAIAHFGYPQKLLVQDFSHTFDGLSDAVFYGNTGDPYPESAQPYVGESTVNITISNPPTVDPAKKVLIIITTQPLFAGFNFQQQNLKYRSRYVFVDAAQSTDFLFNYMHPGSYYVNALYDQTGDYNFSSGDYMNSAFDVPFTLSAESTSSVNVTINFLIP